MTGDKALLSQFEEKAGPLVTFGDNIKGFTMDIERLFLEILSLIIKKTGEVALNGERKGSLIFADLDSTNKDGICCFYTKASEEQSKLWHKKLSNLNFKAINTLVKKELVRDMPKLDFAQVDVCEAFEALAFENLNINSDSDGEDEVNTQQMLNEEFTEQENHGNGSSSQTPEFDSTNSGGERDEGSNSYTNNEDNDEGTSQQTHTRKWDRSHTR
ncbi:hypothetical protein AgCh_038458 [Apium graveolens]